jgi:Ca2+-binding EF-hand superfamily protein
LDNDASSETRDIFDIFDVNGNGRLPVEKIGHAMRSLGRNPTMPELRQFLDERSDGNASWIGYEEFEEICKRQRAAEEAVDKKFLIDSIKFALRAFDRDGTGFIDRAELKGGTLVALMLGTYLAVLIRVGEALDGTEADELLRVFGGANSKNQVAYEGMQRRQWFWAYGLYLAFIDSIMSS